MYYSSLKNRLDRMKISNKTYLVGSGETGVGISHKLDCNIYLVDGGEECALIDAGSGLDPNRIITNIKQDGIKIDNIKYILLTHIHGDHAAGAAHFAKKFNIKLILSKEDVARYESGDMDKNSIYQEIDAGIK